jgi:hypothetical protein
MALFASPFPVLEVFSLFIPAPTVKGSAGQRAFLPVCRMADRHGKKFFRSAEHHPRSVFDKPS